MKLSKLIKLPLRTIWKHEAQDFTKWLAKEENLLLLSETIGITLANAQTEVGVGKYSVDILAYDDDDNNRKVVIENQIESTDHKHLGQLITYASGLDAEICIWVVARAQQEHEQAIKWLNENTTEDVNFFLIEIEAWQIDKSLPAAKFNIVAKPNDWLKAVKQKGRGSSELTDIQLQQQEFWNKMREYGEKTSENIRSWQSARPRHWYNISLGSTRAHLAGRINSRDKVISMDFYIGDDEDLFHSLESKQREIEKQLGYELQWRQLPEKKACIIRVERQGDFQDEDQQNELVEWMVEKAEEFTKVFKKYL